MKYLFLLSCSFLVVAPALAQETAGRYPDDEIVVTATGTRLKLDQTGQVISVVGAGEIAAIQGPDLTRVLERLPGVSFSRNGGLGSQTGLNVRGGNADQLLVMVDGVRVADYASPGGGYDLGNLLSGNLARVELLRGSNSVIWGSQAMAGVLAVTTREVSGVELSGEYGAYDTAYANGTAGVASDRYAVSLSAGYARSDGFSAQKPNTEPDGYRQWELAGKGRVALGDSLTLRANGRYADSLLDYDQVGPSYADSQATREGTGRVVLEYAGEALSLTAAVAYAGVRRHYETGWGPSDFRGSSWRGELSGRLELPSDLALDFGADSEWSRTESTYDPQRKARLSSGHLMLGYHGTGASLAVGVRLDDHSRFGSHWTLGANGSVMLGHGWRLRASYGEGFKAPTLYQLFGSFVGNAAVKPETSRSYDAGLEWNDRNAPLHAALTVFRRDSRNLIDLDTSFLYQNIARARAEGVELELGARVSERFSVQAAYTYLKARDLSAGRDLARRPRNMVSVSADWRTPLHDLTLGADVRMASDAIEYDFFGTPTALDGYGLLTLRASLPVTDRIEVYGRIENVTDTRYETAAGYNTPGRSAYVGVRARF